MADYNTFVAGFPEFLGDDPALVNAKLNLAIAEVDAGACGTLADAIIYYKTAQSLALMPSGNTSKLSSSDGRTVYDAKLRSLIVEAVGGPVAP